MQMGDLQFLGMVRRKYVYGMNCDGTPTLYVCEARWDGKLRLTIRHGEFEYVDACGRPILADGDDEEEYADWYPKARLRAQGLTAPRPRRRAVSLEPWE
jgi:hypothetical protein